jgi:hypothetical protein
VARDAIEYRSVRDPILLRGEGDGVFFFGRSTEMES